MHRDRNARWRHRTGAQHGGAGRDANLIFVLPPNVYVGPPGRGDFLVSNFHPGPIPGKFGVKRFLAVRRSWRENGVACFWATSFGKNLSAAAPRAPPCIVLDPLVEDRIPSMLALATQYDG
jgi:hypothetical protein